MEEIGTRVSEDGALNKGLTNTSSPNNTFEYKVNVDISKKRKFMEPRMAC